jgi:hypothetical protein
MHGLLAAGLLLTTSGGVLASGYTWNGSFHRLFWDWDMHACFSFFRVFFPFFAGSSACPVLSFFLRARCSIAYAIFGEE